MRTVELASSPEHTTPVDASADAPDVAVPGSSRTSIRGSALLLCGRFLAIAAGLIIQVLIVRYLSQEAYGAFAYAIAVVNLLTVVVSLGMEQAITRFAAVYDERGQLDRLAG